MKTIKFRGYNLKNNKWIYGYYFVNRGQHFVVEDGIANPQNTWEDYLVEADTIGQFTGLLDKNGVEIYEGDIIGCHNPSIKHLIFYNEKQGRFMAALNGDIENYFVGVCGLDDSRWNVSKKVIGNTYDNPELINGKEKQQCQEMKK